jgi:Ca-activated chloride channel family protein
MYSDRGDFAAAQQSLAEARQTLADLDPSDMLMEEQESLADLEADYREGNLSRARKKAFSQSFNLSRSGRSKPRRSLDGE